MSLPFSKPGFVRGAMSAFRRAGASAGSSPSRLSQAPKSVAHSQSALLLDVWTTSALCSDTISHFDKL